MNEITFEEVKLKECYNVRNNVLDIKLSSLCITCKSFIDKKGFFNIKKLWNNNIDAFFILYTRFRHKIDLPMLINKGVNVNVYSKDAGKYSCRTTALMYACKYTNKDIVELLINKGADVNVKNKHGETALMHACTYSDLSIVKVLINKGADVNAKYNDGFTPLMFACLECDKDKINYLINKGADVNVKNKYGNPALFCIRDRHKNQHIVKLLLNRGADVNTTDKNGTTILMDSCLYEDSKDIVELLLERGAEVNAVDKFGSTALRCASPLKFEGDKFSIINNIEIINLLKQYGAK